MTKEVLEKAIKIEQSIKHISEVIDFIKDQRELDEVVTNIFIADEADDYIGLNGDEIKVIIDALERKKDRLEQEFAIL